MGSCSAIQLTIRDIIATNAYVLSEIGHKFTETRVQLQHQTLPSDCLLITDLIFDIKKEIPISRDIFCD